MTEEKDIVGEILPPTPDDENLEDTYYDVDEDLGFTGNIKRYIRRIIFGTLAACMILIAGITFCIFFVFWKITIAIGLITSAILKGTYHLFMLIFQKLIGLMVAGGVIAGSMYLFWKANPELERQFDAKLFQINQLLVDNVGLSLPKIPSFKDIADIFGEVNVQLPTGVTNSATARTVGSLSRNYSIPSELKPLLNITQDAASIERYAKLFSSGKIGRHAEGSIPELSKGLKSGDKKLEDATFKVLKLIDSPEARRTFRKYKRILEKEAKDANLRY